MKDNRKFDLECRKLREDLKMFRKGRKRNEAAN